MSLRRSCLQGVRRFICSVHSQAPQVCVRTYSFHGKAKGVLQNRNFLKSEFYCHHRTMSTRLFEGKDHAKSYAKYRPTYPESVFVEIEKYCRETNSGELTLALDVGCGNGQSTLPLTKYFKQVIGLDVSDKQIQEAKSASPEIDFRVGPAEDLRFQADETVDLMTVAQAFHWMDAEKLYSEVSRVLKPGGALVVYGYGNCELDNEKSQELISVEFYKGTLGVYWDVKRRHIDNLLADFILPFENWSRNDSLNIEKTWTVDDFVGYLSSWSAWVAYRRKSPDTELLEDTRMRLKKHYTDPETQELRNMKVTWPVYMLMGHKPGLVERNDDS